MSGGRWAASASDDDVVSTAIKSRGDKAGGLGRELTNAGVGSGSGSDRVNETSREEVREEEVDGKLEEGGTTESVRE